MSLLHVKNLSIYNQHNVELVKGSSFDLQEGEWLAIIGESGSGKSLTAFSLTGLQPEGITVKAESIRYQDTELTSLPADRLRQIRGKDIAYVFQDYQTAFTPYKKIGVQMDETIVAHLDWNAQERKQKSLAALENIGLDAEAVYERYPFQLSGGQLQRTVLALAVLLEPKLLIADEPTTALDAVNARNVLDLISTLKKEKNCSVLFISHDLRVVRKYADRVAIMRKGEIIEMGNKEEILNNPRQSYTRNLLASIPPLRNIPKRLPIFTDTTCDEPVNTGEVIC